MQADTRVCLCVRCGVVRCGVVWCRVWGAGVCARACVSVVAVVVAWGGSRAARVGAWLQETAWLHQGGASGLWRQRPAAEGHGVLEARPQPSSCEPPA